MIYESPSLVFVGTKSLPLKTKNFASAPWLRMTMKRLLARKFPKAFFSTGTAARVSSSSTTSSPPHRWR